MQPYLVKEVRDPDREATEQRSLVQSGRLFLKNRHRVSLIMEKVIEEGSGVNALWKDTVLPGKREQPRRSDPEGFTSQGNISFLYWICNP